MVVAIGSASLIGSASMGARQTFGLFVEPMSSEFGFSPATVAFAIALHNLVWGLAQPFTGAAADRYGAGPVVAAGSLLLAGGLGAAAFASSAFMLVLGMGVLFGLGVSCTSFGVVLTAIGRAARPEQQSLVMGIASAGGSLGQVLFVPYAQFLSQNWGAALALIGLTILVSAVAPLGYLIRSNSSEHLNQEQVYMPARSAALKALGHNGYCLLTLGFFTCGFQLAFIATHLPAYLNLCSMPAGTGATALAVIGFFNILGSWVCGWLGGRCRQRSVLALLYLARAVAIAMFILAPKSEASVLAFAAVMGFLWLGTVPLTTGVIARLFGARHLGTLFGLCFLSHQVGSFLGSWTGGLVLEITGSYTPIWIATSAAGFMAAALHMAIRDTPAYPAAARAE
ncbi:MAG TPA: MFS transporter [Rhizobiaceae bacterium]|nr:MFS transporter [Rhizobiaceae bacterium]